MNPPVETMDCPLQFSALDDGVWKLAHPDIVEIRIAGGKTVLDLSLLKNQCVGSKFRDVRLSLLRASTTTVFTDKVKKYIIDGWTEPIDVVQMNNGRLVIWDGNHRASAAFLLGHKTILAKVTPELKNL